MHHHHSNPTLSILFGAFLGILSFLAKHQFIIDFGFDLLKVILFGFVGGIMGALGKRFYEIITRKNSD